MNLDVEVKKEDLESGRYVIKNKNIIEKNGKIFTVFRLFINEGGKLIHLINMKLKTKENETFSAEELVYYALCKLRINYVN